MAGLVCLDIMLLKNIPIRLKNTEVYAYPPKMKASICYTIEFSTLSLSPCNWLLYRTSIPESWKDGKRQTDRAKLKLVHLKRRFIITTNAKLLHCHPTCGTDHVC